MLGQETEPRQQQDGEPELDLTTLPRYRVKSRCPSCGRPRTAGREVMRAVAETLRTDRSYAAAILEPIEIFGVDDFAESQVTNKARLKTCPLEQWRVGREYRRRLKKAFEAARIDTRSRTGPSRSARRAARWRSWSGRPPDRTARNDRRAASRSTSPASGTAQCRPGDPRSRPVARPER